MPERPRAPVLAYDPFEATRETGTADTAAAEVARWSAADPQHVVCELTDRLNRSLFGVGLRLHAALAGIQDPRAARHVQAALGDLDLAITELRHVVFDLHTATAAPAVSRPAPPVVSPPGGGGTS